MANALFDPLYEPVTGLAPQALDSHVQRGDLFPDDHDRAVLAVRGQVGAVRPEDLLVRLHAVRPVAVLLHITWARAPKLVLQLAQQRDEDLFLRVEVGVEGAVRRVRGVGDVGDPRIREAVAREDLPGRVQQGLPAPPSPRGGGKRANVRIGLGEVAGVDHVAPHAVSDSVPSKSPLSRNITRP